MPYEVKMPQLGMNQDSAVIVSWLKSTGDKVSVGEPIFEVETDKATMEVEATAEGMLAEIRAAEGDEIPVGDVIALLVETEAELGEYATPDVATPLASSSRAVAGPSAQASDPIQPPRQAVEPVETSPPNVARVAAPAGKVLASPLAKRLATERGIDLSSLRADGVSEPIHAGDLLRGTPRGQTQLSAKVDGSAFDALLNYSEEADRTALLAAFAEGGWRKVFDGDTVAVAVRQLDGTLSNPSDTGSPETGPSALTLVDLCDTRLGSYAPAGGGITLSVARDSAAYALTLSFNEGTLPFLAAAAFLDAVAARTEDPIRQIL